MTTKAENSLKLYRGGNPQTIIQLLRIQQRSVVEELLVHCNATSLEDLALKLSLGAY